MLDQASLNALSADQKQIYRDYQKLFELPGWEYIKNYATQNHNNEMASELQAQSWNDVLLARGARAAHKVYSTLEEMIDVEFQQLADEAKEAQIPEIDEDDDADL